jgi:predicted nucleotide-binding protein
MVDNPALMAARTLPNRRTLGSGGRFRRGAAVATRKGQSSMASDEGPISLRRPIDEAKGMLEQQIAKGRAQIDLLESVRSPESFRDQTDAYRKWSTYNGTLLGSLFSGPILAEYETRGPLFVGRSNFGDDLLERDQDLKRDVRRLESIVERLPLWASEGIRPLPDERAAEATMGERVFVVHGRDDAPKFEVARFLEQVGIDALLLSEQPNSGRTLVEKLVHYSGQVGFAVVILTPDDIGALADQRDSLTPRARQNVIFEMGYFIGLIGRGRVCALLTSDLQRPSDIDGVVYVEMSGNWKIALAKELGAAGFVVDLSGAS